MSHRRGSLVVLVIAVVLASLVDGATATATDRGNHAPDPPTRLTVGGRDNPLAVDDTPRFGWLPRDRDGNEVQTAHQIVVTRSGATVWDSGKVVSASQSWVPYAGPRLSPGATYRWTVRTWDRHGAASPYARPATFDTGLGDGDWSGATWIRRDTAGNDAADEWTLARSTIALGERPIVRARAYVAAMGDWELHVDGRAVDRGSSHGYPGEGYYDVSALPGLRPGRTLTVGVRYHYWSCRCQGRANGPASPEGPSGLLAKVVVEYADGTRDVLVSDGSWQVAKDTARDVSTLTFRNSDAGDRVERYDATREVTGWDRADHDTGAWTQASVIGPHPRPNPVGCADTAPCAFTHLTAQQARLDRWTIHPVSVRRLADGTVFADLGRVVSAVPRIEFVDGDAGHQVTVTTSYRRGNTTLAAPVADGADTVSLVSTTNLRPGDELVVDAPANGYGPGAPESRVVTSVGPQGTVTLNTPLTRSHTEGAWVENSRAGVSGLDTQGSDMRFHYTQKPGQQVAEPFTYWGFRYLEISDPGEELAASRIAAVVQATDVRPNEAATFDSSDPTLDAVVDLMRHSALQSAQNVFLDTPTREKGQFLGDAIDISFATMEALGERALTRQAILEFAYSQGRHWPNGALNAVYPNGDGGRDIPDYTEMFPEWVMRYHHLTGDTDLVARTLPVMRRIAGYLTAAVDETGLVHQLPGGNGPYLNGIIDWPAAMRYDSVVSDNGSRTVVNALAVGALRAVADASALVGDPAGAREHRARADAIASAMNRQLRDQSTGRYTDGLALSTGDPINSHSQHAQSFPLAYGVAPPSAYPALGDYLSGLGMRQGPMTLRQLLAALAKTGRTDTIVRLLTDPDDDGPAQVLAEGGTFLWEQWTPGCAVAGCTRAQVDQRSSESFSHGWGAAGIVEVLRSLLGVQVTDPGAAEVRISVPDKGLRSAHGTEWTERGPVEVDWRRTGDGLRLVVDVPVNVTATVVLPAGDYRAWGAGAPRPAGDDNDRVVFTVGSGRTHFGRR
jgi:Bacterial alpha-L-rhamnosidase 6 hairpin glycosidase domain/Bacterial alpha-L-rhamnosidase C-terminal domain/Alpha-L-rhamnosidase N-terminal domain